MKGLEAKGLGVGILLIELGLSSVHLRGGRTIQPGEIWAAGLWERLGRGSWMLCSLGSGSERLAKLAEGAGR